MNNHVAEPFRSVLNSAVQMVDGIPVDYSTCPANHRESVRRWIEGGIHPGSGLNAVLRHDLEAVVICDDDTVKQLPALLRWLHNHAPSLCHGSRESVEAWGKARRAAR